MSSVDTIKLLGVLNLTAEHKSDILALASCRRRRPVSRDRAKELERLTLARPANESQWELTKLGREIAVVLGARRRGTP